MKGRQGLGTIATSCAISRSLHQNLRGEQATTDGHAWAYERYIAIQSFECNLRFGRNCQKLKTK